MATFIRSAVSAALRTQMIRRHLSSNASLKEVVIVGVARTPIGSFAGALATISAPKLGSIAISGALERAHVKASDVGEVIMGNVISAGAGQAPARQAAKGAGCSDSVCCTTVNKVCASGMKAITLGAQSIMLGNHSVVVAGGMESMSNIPYISRTARKGSGLGHQMFEDLLLYDGLTDVYNKDDDGNNIHMGVCAEHTAAKYDISREENDRYCLQSYARSAEAAANGTLGAEIVPVEIPGRKGKVTIVSEDEEYKNLKADKVPLLKPVFKKGGVVTAANASKLNDGAAAVVLMSREECDKRGLVPLARILSYADAEGPSIDFPTAPAMAVETALQRAGLTVADIACWEINEAFSVVALANAKLLGLDESKVNPDGGAVALGHPIGASGARLTGALALKLKKGEIGCASICNGGGGATAILVEKL